MNRDFGAGAFESGFCADFDDFESGFCADFDVFVLILNQDFVLILMILNQYFVLILNQDFVMEEETPHGVFEDAGLG